MPRFGLIDDSLQQADFVTTYLVTKKGLSSNLADDFRHME